MAHSVKLDTLSMEELQQLVEDAQKALAEKVAAKRQELMKELSALDAMVKPNKPAATEVRNRSPRKKLYRHPTSGNEYGRTSTIPNEFTKMGVKSWEDMEQYRIPGA